MHFEEEEEFMENDDKLNYEISNWSFITKKFVMEILLMIFIPLPNFDYYITFEDVPPGSTDNVVYTYLLSEFMLVVMVLRIGFMFRAIMKFNIYNRPYAIRLFKAYG